MGFRQGEDGSWSVGARLATAQAPLVATGTPALLADQGPSQLLVPEPGGLAHYARASAALASAWHKLGMLDALNGYTAVALMKSEYARLEAVGRRADGSLAALQDRSRCTERCVQHALCVFAQLSRLRHGELAHADAGERLPRARADPRRIGAAARHVRRSPYNYPERRLEIYSPPYLFAGELPHIDAVSDVGYGPGDISVQISGHVSASDIARAVLMAPGSVTHGFDSGQRAVELTISARSTSKLLLVRPPNAKIAPRGDYMLFLLSNAGVPSIAKFVRL